MAGLRYVTGCANPIWTSSNHSYSYQLDLSYLSAECLQSQFADVQCDDGIEGITESLS
jgi:hypothetical protein